MNRLICSKCNRSFSLDEKIWACPCGGLLDLHFQPAFPVEKIQKRKPTLWRYREAIPILRDENILSFDEGFTPLLPVDFNGRNVWLKQDHLFPTGSYKDRGAAVLMSKVKELGVARVVEDSSGNAGCAIAAYSAKGGIEAEIFAPQSTSPGKLVQIRSYGAVLKTIPGSREETAKAVLSAARTGYYASHSWNPFFFQGTKTFAYEIWEQLGWKEPDTVILPVGNGTLLLGAYLGFAELLDAGMIRGVPKIVGVQSASCAPLVKAFRQGLEKIPAILPRKTVAEGIAIATPIRGEQIVTAVKKSGGGFLAVDEEEIEKSLRWACERGFYVEPTSAAAVAAVFKYLETSDSEEIIVSTLTGHGLKATEKILKILQDTH